MKEIENCLLVVISLCARAYSFLHTPAKIALQHFVFLYNTFSSLHSQKQPLARSKLASTGNKFLPCAT